MTDFWIRLADFLIIAAWGCALFSTLFEREPEPPPEFIIHDWTKL